jgi:hypothetical protein
MSGAQKSRIVPVRVTAPAGLASAIPTKVAKNVRRM